MNSEIFEKVRKIIADKLDIEEDKITPESSFLDDLGADSLDIVELIMELEEESTLKFQMKMRKRLEQLPMQ